jgi:hypothetical protein
VATFALFYNKQDLAAIAGTIQNPGLSAGERQEVNRYWQGGLNAWATAPYGCSPFDDPNDPNNAETCVIAMDVNQRTLTDFRNFLYTIAEKYGDSFTWLRAMANDMAGNSGAVEPWPYV